MPLDTAVLRSDEAGKLLLASANDAAEVAGEGTGSEDRALAALASFHPGTRGLLAFRDCGHMRYYGVPDNVASPGVFRKAVAWLWWRTRVRRGQRRGLTWHRMQHYIQPWLPPAHVYHAYRLIRFGVTT